MDKLRAQYALHKKYRQTIHHNIGSNNDVLASNIVEKSNQNSVNDMSSSKTVSETIISNSSGDTGKTSITSSISGTIDSNRLRDERVGRRSMSSYRPLGTIIPNSTTKKEMKSEQMLGILEPHENCSEHIVTQRHILEKHIEQSSIRSSPKNDADQKSLPPKSPRRNQETDAQYTTHNHNHIIIPTEAQLRWAQFHMEKRANMTKQKVEALMKSPLHVHEVKGALQSDGDSSSDESNIGRSTNSVPISKGRKALLRVSARKMENRKEKIERYGFEMKPDIGVENMQHEEKSILNSSALDETLQFADIAAALQETHDEDNFIQYDRDDTVSPRRCSLDYDSTKVKSARKKSSNSKWLKGMRSIVQSPDEEEERMQRFEDAYKLLCKVAKDSNAPDYRVISSSKRWTRDSSLPVVISIDGREYGDLQRSPTFRYEDGVKYYGPEVMAAEVNGIQLTDKSASWMTHIPKRDKRKVNFFGKKVNFGPSTFLSPQKLKLLDIVDRVHMFEKHSIPVDDNTDEPQSNTDRNIKKAHSNANFSQNASSDQRNIASHSLNSASYSKMPTAKNVTDRNDIVSANQGGSSDGNESNFPALESKIISMVSTIANNRVVDTDTRSESSVEDDGKVETRVDTLMLSPRILTKRLNQAIVAIQTCRWHKVRALIRANKWLADMIDVNCNQYLLHKLSFYGAGTIQLQDSILVSAPKSLFDEFIEASSSIVHKVDVDGNLPLHLACQSGNFEMVSHLCACFPGGASVRNQDGLLPLHLAILSVSNSKVKNPLVGITEVLHVFPLALTVADNNGNLPIHHAVSHLSGEVGAQIVHTLIEEAESRKLSLRFGTQKNGINHIDMNDVIHEDTSSLVNYENDSHKNSMLSVKNDIGMNPLVTAICRGAGWEILDELLSHEGIEETVLDLDEDGKTVLQLAMNRDVCDGPSIVSILRAAPSLVNIRDEKSGALPIETACLNGLQHEVITAIVLLDLPIDLDNDKVIYRDKYGGSWWYLNCDCDDAYAKVVEEILELCEYEQKRALCFVKNKSSETLISRATPRCKRILRESLRFAGRYEFVGSADKTGLPQNVKAFDALDFGESDEGSDNARQVVLIYYENRRDYLRDVSVCVFSKNDF